MGRVRRPVRLEHVVAVAVIGGDQTGPASVADGGDHVAEAGVDRLDRGDRRRDDAGVADHVRVGEVDDPEVVSRLPTSASTKRVG